MNERVLRMASNLISHSVALEKGENLLIEVFDAGFELAEALIGEAQKLGANPFLQISPNQMQRALLMNASLEQLRKTAEFDTQRMKQMDAYIAIRGSCNDSELSDVPVDKMQSYQTEYYKPVHMETRITDTKWCVMRYPTPAFAQKANMSIRALEDYYFDVCGLDYKKMGEHMEALVDYMNKSDKVRLVGDGTDLTFSIKGYPAVKCFGRRNIPDGEVLVAPAPGSANGTITYNIPCDYMNFVFENVSFKLKDGVITDAGGNNVERINRVLDTDEGARRFGEFAIGINPFITEPIVDTLFDEKMTGSLHLTPGNSYLSSYNHNTSAVHWDLILAQTPEFGGGEIWFDDVLVRKDGLFVVDELKGLNPENLK